MHRPQTNKTEQVYDYICEHYCPGDSFRTSDIIAGLPHINPNNISSALYNLRERHAVIDGERHDGSQFYTHILSDAPRPHFYTGLPEGLRRQNSKQRADTSPGPRFESRRQLPDTFPEEQYGSALFDIISLWMEEMEAMRQRIAELEDCPDLSLVPDSELFAELKRRKETGAWTKPHTAGNGPAIDCKGTRR